MRLTIVRETNSVVIDNVGFVVDCSKLPADVHAIQWDGASGEIEFAQQRCDHCGARSKKANEFFRDVTPYQYLVEGWHDAKEKHEAAERERKAAAERARAEENERAQAERQAREAARAEQAAARKAADDNAAPANG